jgi:hypothetical protein
MLVTDTANFRNPNYHQPSDTIDTLDFAFATNVTRAILATTVEYLTVDADRDGEPDVCSGPLSATPTPALPATPVLPAELPTRTPTDAEPSGLPDTGQGPDGGRPLSATVLLAIVIAGAASWVAWRALVVALRRS